MKTTFESFKASMSVVWPVLLALFFVTLYGIRRFDIIETELRHLNDYNWTLFDQIEWQARVAKTYTNVPDPADIFRLNHGTIKPNTPFSALDPRALTKP